jgi:hypothetical protein
MSLVLLGSTSGSVTLQEPAVAGTTTLTLPAVSGTILQSGTTVTEAQGGTGTTTGYYGFKNRLINGSMVIDQRNAGASVTPNNSYTLDRWVTSNSQTSKFTVEQTITGVSAPVGFTDYLAVTSSSAYSVLTGDYFAVYQPIEGFNVADFAWGTASAATVTLSFWIRSSLTGTFGGSIRNSAGNRSYPFSYTISAANTWEQKTITIAGDTSGTWATNNTNGMSISFGLGAGSTFSGTAGAWAAGNFISATGATSVVGTNGATFYITGVQLEKGSTATSFDYRPYSAELALCQRYYQRWNTGTAGLATWSAGVVINSTNVARTVATLSTPMRSSPTFNYSNVRLYDGNAAPTVTSIPAQACTATNMCVDLTASGGGLTVGRIGLVIEDGPTGYVVFSSEL